LKIYQFFQSFKFDFWAIWGFIGQSFFFLRLIIQWIQSEREHKSVVSKSFWWLGIIGALMTFVYAVARKDIVFLLTAILQMFFYSRNLMLNTKD
jgi:lipid-A-disaccharide synthase-like uncharacterized protein